MSSHSAVENHPLRPLHRTLAGLTGGFLAVFGVLGLVETGDAGAFDRLSATVLGIKTNVAFSVVALLVGLVVLAVTAIGRNLDARVNTWLAYLLFVLGSVMLALMQTEGNVLNATITSTVVVYLAGCVLLTAGLYSRVSTARA
ncbi:hypothetical protein GCM10010124_24300 [Pilimelia terevasa]|uniref:DUF4383 domain-containing protein n=1 Tax=Pilimelia terevasa TaxID=53372 RepID=A0A8J3BLD3_9ACTN|nr:DUF4383 domain-containing protein [Pilimelia terevasa]GGK30728.1 hypothetical protein GCM10010124_24300 [Pilimelia terevasa]